jgi:hypothetical protein
MKYALLLSGLLAIAAYKPASAQTPSKLQAVAAEIKQEGLALYESERASWVGTDLLMARKPDMADIVGYISYADGDSLRTLFMQQTPDKTSFAAKYSFSFPRAAIQPTAGRAFAARPASARELKLFEVRLKAMEELESNKVLGKPYQFPENTRPNVVVLDNGSLRAYVLTGPQESNVLPIGNDVLMRFSAAGKLTQVQPLHSSYLAMRLPEGYQNIEAGMHSHLPAHPYITPTDFCSLLLYKDVFPAPQHIVMGREYVSVLDIEKQELVILTKKAYDKIRESRE